MNDLKRISPASLEPRRQACTHGAENAENLPLMVPLHGLSVVDVRGKDARAFLQSKLTTDLKKLDERGASYGYATDINGRVIFDAHLAKVDDNHFRLWSEPEQEDTIVQALDKYIIMEDVTLEPQAPRPRWMVVGASLASLAELLSLPDARLHGYTKHEDLGILTLARSIQPSVLLEGAVEATCAILQNQGVQCLPWDVWRAHEIQKGFVRTGFDLIYEQTIPLEAGPDLGVDYNKGCYLGQEVIERLRSRGTPNREYRRVQIEGDVAEAPFQVVDDEGRDMGIVTSVAKIPEGTFGIAVIRRRALQQEPSPAALFAETPSGARIQILGDVC